MLVLVVIFSTSRFTLAFTFSGMEVTPAILLTLKTEPVQVFDKTALTWIVPRKNPGFAELVNRMAQESAKVGIVAP
jgi:hypothetical protein